MSLNYCTVRVLVPLCVRSTLEIEDFQGNNSSNLLVILQALHDAAFPGEISKQTKQRESSNNQEEMEVHMQGGRVAATKTICMWAQPYSVDTNDVFRYLYLWLFVVWVGNYSGSWPHIRIREHASHFLRGFTRACVGKGVRKRKEERERKNHALFWHRVSGFQTVLGKPLLLHNNELWWMRSQILWNLPKNVCRKTNSPNSPDWKNGRTAS